MSGSASGSAEQAEHAARSASLGSVLVTPRAWWALLLLTPTTKAAWCHPALSHSSSLPSAAGTASLSPAGISAAKDTAESPCGAAVGGSIGWGSPAGPL